MGLRQAFTTQQTVVGLIPEIQHVRVSFDGGVVVCKPHALYEDGQLTPFIVEDANGVDYGNWITTMDMARLYLPTGSQRIIYRKGGDERITPIDKLEREIRSAKMAKIAPPEWEGVFPEKDFSGGRRQELYITNERGCVIFLATLIMNRNALEETGSIYLVHVSRSTGHELISLLSNYNALPDVFQDPDAALQIIPVPQQVKIQGGQRVIVPNHYEVKFVSLTSMGIKFDVNRWNVNQMRIIENKWNWDNIITIPTDKEIINRLVSSSIPPSAIAYALEDYKDHINPKYWELAERELNVLSNRASASEQPAPDVGTQIAGVQQPVSGRYTIAPQAPHMDASSGPVVSEPASVPPAGILPGGYGTPSASYAPTPPAEEVESTSENLTVSPEELQAQINRLLQRRRS